jgi:hypothetical protein
MREVPSLDPEKTLLTYPKNVLGCPRKKIFVILFKLGFFRNNFFLSRNFAEVLVPNSAEFSVPDSAEFKKK